MGGLPSFAGECFATHLHVRSGFSSGQAVAYPEELVSAAAGMDYESLALTDRDGLYGIPKFLAACSSYGIAPIAGAEITVEVSGEHPKLFENFFEKLTGFNAFRATKSRF